MHNEVNNLMGYEIHINREPGHGNLKPLTFEEWTKFCETDLSISASPNEQGVYHWTDHPLGGIEGEQPWMLFSNGQISTRNPDEFLTLKMFEIAIELEAKLSDDESVLDNEYKSQLSEVTQKIVERAGEKLNSKPWWKF